MTVVGVHGSTLNDESNHDTGSAIPATMNESILKGSWQ